jgi:hypothetical protein
MSLVEEVRQFLSAPRGGSGWGVYKAIVSTNDTISVGDFTFLHNVVMIRLDTNATVTCTKATNVITITAAALSSVLVLFFVQGV